LQLGTEALRALLLKRLAGISYSESIAASMIVKGLKFAIIGILAAIVLVFFFFSEQGLFLRIALISGFCIILLAACLFLLPMNKKIGLKISGFFGKLSRFHKKFLLAQKYFEGYANYLEETQKKLILLTGLFCFVSLLFEFLALLFSFASAGAFIAIESMLVLFVIINILERTPFLPRGIGLVEAVSLVFVSSASAISMEKTAAAIIIFDIARLVVPTVLSIIIHATVFRKYSENQFSRTLKNKKPEQTV